MSKEYNSLTLRANYLEQYLQYLSVNNIINVQGRYPIQSVNDANMEYYVAVQTLTDEYVDKIRAILEKQLNKDLEKIEAIEILLKED